MVEGCEDTPSALSRGESVETKLHRIAGKAFCSPSEWPCEEPCA